MAAQVAIGVRVLEQQWAAVPDETMTIYVKSSPTAGQRKGDWLVTTDGGAPISRHRTKSKAMEVGRREARKRNTTVRYQNSSNGQWNTGPSF